MNSNIIKYGMLPHSKENNLINHILLMFKMVLFEARNSIKPPTIHNFMAKLKDTYDVEHYIAGKKNKLSYHFMKWSLYIEYMTIEI